MNQKYEPLETPVIRISKEDNPSFNAENEMGIQCGICQTWIFVSVPKLGNRYKSTCPICKSEYIWSKSIKSYDKLGECQ